MQAAQELGVALLDAKAAQHTAETERDAAEAALADALAVEHAPPTRPAMVNADANTTYMVDGLGLAAIGTQTDDITPRCTSILQLQRHLLHCHGLRLHQPGMCRHHTHRHHCPVLSHNARTGLSASESLTAAHLVTEM